MSNPVEIIVCFAICMLLGPLATGSFIKELLIDGCY